MTLSSAILCTSVGKGSYILNKLFGMILLIFLVSSMLFLHFTYRQIKYCCEVCILYLNQHGNL